jgi:hypothetical protein
MGFFFLHGIKLKKDYCLSHILYFMRNLNWVLTQEPDTCKQGEIHPRLGTCSDVKEMQFTVSYIYIYIYIYEILDDLPNRQEKKS